MENDLERFTLPVLKILVVKNKLSTTDFFQEVSKTIQITQLEWVFVLRNLLKLELIEKKYFTSYRGEYNHIEEKEEFIVATEKSFELVLFHVQNTKPEITLKVKQAIFPKPIKENETIIINDDFRINCIYIYRTEISLKIFYENNIYTLKMKEGDIYELPNHKIILMEIVCKKWGRVDCQLKIETKE